MHRYKMMVKYPFLREAQTAMHTMTVCKKSRALKLAPELPDVLAVSPVVRSWRDSDPITSQANVRSLGVKRTRRRCAATAEFDPKQPSPLVATWLWRWGSMLELVGGSMSSCQLASFSISITRRAPNQRLQTAAIAAEMPNHTFGRA